MRDRRIPIDPQVYFPLIFEDIEVAVSGALARLSLEDMNMLAQHGVIQVHRQVVGEDKPRHHCVHFVTERLLGITAYADRFDAAVAEIHRAPILVVTPSREACMAMAGRAVDRLAERGLGAPIFYSATLVLGGPEGLSEEELTVRRKLAEAPADDEILIVTDAWINDASLTQFQKSLRNERYRGRIRYLIGIARPESLDDWRHTRARLEYRTPKPDNVVQAVMTIPVPDWGDAHCPWCEETRLYENWAQRATLPAFLATRRDALATQARSGLEQDVLLGLPHLPRMEIGPGSFYIQQYSTEAEAFASVASTLQRLRTRPEQDGPALGPKRFPVSTVLKSNDYTHETWSDAILRGMFLRGATREELVHTDSDKERHRTTAIRDLITRRSHLEHAVLLEVLLAAGLQKVHLDVDQELRDALLAVCGEHEESRAVVSYMLDQIEEDQRERMSRALRGVSRITDKEDQG
jgi:hypothetical protein